MTRRPMARRRSNLCRLAQLNKDAARMRAPPSRTRINSFTRRQAALFAGSVCTLYAHPEFAYAVVDLMRVRASVAENQATPCRWCQIASGQGYCGNTPLGSLPRNRHIVGATRQQCHQMHPCFGTNDLEHISHLDVDRSYQRPSPIHIEHSHPTYMASEVSLWDEIGQDSLIESRGKDVRGIPSAGESRYQILGNNHVAQAQSGKHDFAERPDINDPPIRVQALQRRDRAASKPVLAIIIVFNDPSAGARCPIEEKHTACGTHGYAQGILVRWRHIHSTRVATSADDLCYVHAVVIHSNRNQLSSALR